MKSPKSKGLGEQEWATLKGFINSSQIHEDMGSFPNADTMLSILLNMNYNKDTYEKHQGMSRIK